MKKFLIGILVFGLIFSAGFANSEECKTKVRFKVSCSSGTWYNGVNTLFENIRGSKAYIPEMSLKEFFDNFCAQFPGSRWTQSYGYFYFIVPDELTEDFLKAIPNKEFILYFERQGEIQGINNNGRRLGLDISLEFEHNISISLGFMNGGNKSKFYTIYGKKEIPVGYVGPVYPQSPWNTGSPNIVEMGTGSGFYEGVRRDYTVTYCGSLNLAVQKGFLWSKRLPGFITSIGLGLEFSAISLSEREHWEFSWVTSNDRVEQHGYSRKDTKYLVRPYISLGHRLKICKKLGLEIEYRRLFSEKELAFNVFNYESDQRPDAWEKRRGLNINNKEMLVLGIFFEF